MSEQSKVCTEDTDLPLSVHKVLSHDDLLIEILKRFPLVSLHHIFKYVSKHWQSLIKSPVLSPHWRKNQKIDPPSGFFLKSSSGYDFVSLDSRISRFSLHSMFREAGNDFVIMQSCNGLLLCCIKPNKYYVYNPTTNSFKMIPECEDLPFEWLSKYSGMRLAFDPTKSPHYKVLQIVGVGEPPDLYHHWIRLHTYSSETGIWSSGRELIHVVICDAFSKGIYWNDAIHGIEDLWSVCHRKFSSIEEYQKPDYTLTPLLHDEKVGDNCKLLESCGCLYFVGTVTQHLPIYEMKNGDSEWSLKYVVDLDDVMKLLHGNQRGLYKWDCSRIWSIVLGEREEETFLVMELFGKVVQYNIVLKSLCEVGDLKSISPPDMDPAKFDMFQFIASSASM